MAKTILKIGYITLALVLAILFGVLNYNTGADTAYLDKLEIAALDEDPEKIVYTLSSFSQPYESKPFNTVEVEGKNKMSLFGTLNQTIANYTVGEEAKTYSRVDFMYCFIIKNINFSYGDSLKDGKIFNKSGIRFYNEDGKEYDFHFVVSNSINSEEYVEKPSSVSEYLLNSKRDYIHAYINPPSRPAINFQFMLIPLSETAIEYITKEKLDNKKITGFNLIDNNGNKVYADQNIDLDFNQQFFKDLSTFRDSYRDIYTFQNDKSAEQYTAAETYLKEYNTYTLFPGTTYKEGMAKNEIYNASLVWKTIGIVTLFVLSFGIIYILLFHFSLIKRIIFRDKRQSQKGRYVPNRDYKGSYRPKNTVIDAKVKEIDNNKTENNNDKGAN